MTASAPTPIRLAALARHPPPAELSRITGAIGAAATLALIEAHGGTPVRLPKSVTQGSAIARAIGLDAARALVAWHGAGDLKVPLAKYWRIRIYRAEGLSYTEIARRLGIGTSAVHKHLQMASLTQAQPDLFG